MKPLEGRLFKRFDREQVAREIEEELRFHVEMLTEANLRRDLPLTEATNAALKRFGNVEQIKDQCVEISRSGQPLVRALKAFLIPIFLLGVCVRVFSTELHATHMGDVSMVVAVLGRLFLYVRGLNPASFRAELETSSPLMLNDRSQISMASCDHRKLTPVERVISDK